MIVGVTDGVGDGIGVGFGGSSGGAVGTGDGDGVGVAVGVTVRRGVGVGSINRESCPLPGMLASAKPDATKANASNNGMLFLIIDCLCTQGVQGQYRRKVRALKAFRSINSS